MFHPDSWLIRFLTRVCDLLFLNIVLVLSCCTVVLSGATVTSLYSITLKMMRGQDCDPVKGFFRALRENFLPSSFATILLLTDVALLAVLRGVLYAETLLMPPVAFVLLAIFAVFLTGLLSYLFPLLSRFENTFSHHLSNAIRLSLANLPVTVLITMVNLLPLLIGFLIPTALGVVFAFWLLFGFAAGAWVNAEWQEYVDFPENISVRDGKLLIRPIKTVCGDGSVSYTSGRITTQYKHDFTYGLFEARLKVPKGKGFLPAFWLMTTDEGRYGQWPECGEIDIMEIIGDKTGTNHGTIHYGLPHQQKQGTVTLAQGDFGSEFHDFALLWEPGLLRWYVDGRPFHEERQWFSAGADGVKKPYPAPFDHDMYLILNLAVGGSWVGYPDETTDFANAAFEVDYVRVYQKSESSTEGMTYG